MLSTKVPCCVNCGSANPALASTGQPEPESGELLIAAARDSLPLRGATQLRRGTKHQTSPRSRPPASEPDAAPPSTVRPKKKGPRRGQPSWYDESLRISVRDYVAGKQRDRGATP